MGTVYTESLNKLIEEFERLPGVSPHKNRLFYGPGQNRLKEKEV
jgi:recombinational DNA repair protein RecR